MKQRFLFILLMASLAPPPVFGALPDDVAQLDRQRAQAVRAEAQSDAAETRAEPHQIDYAKDLSTAEASWMRYRTALCRFEATRASKVPDNAVMHACLLRVTRLHNHFFDSN